MTGNKPLTGIRVLEVGAYIAAPYAGSLLCALGADVVKVERTGTGDDFRRLQNDRSPYFRQYNSGKRSLAVDLKSPAGIALVKELIPRFDVLIENLRPGKMDAMGLGPQACAELNPQLVYTSVTGFGSGGPLVSRPAYDAIGQAVGGMYTVLSDEHHAQLSGTCLADLVTGLATATGVLAGLVGRGATGAGQRVETSVMEAVSTLTVDALTQYYADGRRDPSRQSRHPQAQNFCLECSDGRFIAIHLSSSEKFWRSFAAAMSRTDLVAEPRFARFHDRMDRYFELKPIVEAEFIRRPAQEWEKLLADNDVPFTAVHTMSDVIEHPQTQWLGLLEPERDGLALLRAPWRFDGDRPDRPAVTAKVGQHSREVAAEVYDEARIGELIAAGVLDQAPAEPAPTPVSEPDEGTSRT